MKAELPHHNLPPRDYEQFVGRQKELDDVRKLLLPYPKSRYHLVTIDGIGGIGKSALALETAYMFVDQYAALPASERFEAIVWVSAKRNYLTADGILERRQVFRTLYDLYGAIVQVFDYPAIVRAHAEEQIAIVEAVLREQRTLLILDNLETIDDEELLNFLHELPDPAKAIVTTRHRLDVARPVRLTGMPHNDAVALIAQEAVRKGVVLTVEEQEGLWQRTGGVPLAIVWSIGLMGLGGSVESVLRRLGSGQSDIARFCFEESVAQIRGRDSYWLLLALLFFTGDASRDALGVVGGLEGDDFGRDIGLEELLRLSLVNKEGDRFSLSQLTQSFVQADAAKQIEWMEAARQRWHAYFYRVSQSGWTTDWRHQDDVEQDIQNIIATIEDMITALHYQETPDRTLALNPSSYQMANMVIEIIAPTARICRYRGYWNDVDRLCLAEIKIAREINKMIEVAWASYLLGRLAYFRGDMERTELFAKSAMSAFSVAEEQRTYWAYRLLGLIELDRKNLELADALLTKAKDLYIDTGGKNSLQNFIESLGRLNEQRGNLDQAETLYREGLSLAESASDLPYVAYCKLGMGRIAFRQGNYIESRNNYVTSLQDGRDCGRLDAIAQAQLHLASLEIAQGNNVAATAAIQQALATFRRLGMKREQAEAETLLARIEAETSST